MTDTARGHDKTPFKKFRGIETLGIERLGGGELQSGEAEKRVIAYVQHLTRPKLEVSPSRLEQDGKTCWDQLEDDECIMGILDEDRGDS
jgi:hypothetical protein